MTTVAGFVRTYGKGIPTPGCIFHAENLTLEAVWAAAQSGVACLATHHGSPHSHAAIQLAAMGRPELWVNGVERAQLPEDGAWATLTVQSRDLWAEVDAKDPLVLASSGGLCTCMNPDRRYSGVAMRWISKALGDGVSCFSGITCNGYLGADQRMWFASRRAWVASLKDAWMNLDTLRRWINDRWLEYGELYRLVRACEVDLNEGSFESMLNQVVASGALLHWHYSEAIDLHLPFGREDLAGAGGAEIFTWVRENQLGQRLSVDTWTEPLPPPSFAPAPSVSCSSSYGVVLNILELKDWRLVLIQLMLSRLATNRGG